MAYTYLVNQTPATGAVATFNLKTTLKSVGWTVPRSSDGTTYNAAGDQITTGNSGAGGMANNNAWFVIQQPGSTRQWCIQRGTVNYQYRIKVSPSGGFTGGSPSATQVPSATDEVVLLGSGTDAAPTFASLWATTDGGYRQHIVVGGATENYAWVTWCLVTGSSTGAGALMHDAMQANSYVSADLDPYVYYAVNGSGAFSGNQSVNAPNGGAKAYFGALTTAAAANISAPILGASANVSAFPGGVGVSPWSSKDTLIPQAWFRTANNTSPFGWKGFSTLLLAGSVQRTNMDTMNLTGTRDKVFMNGYWLPWDGSVPLI